MSDVLSWIRLDGPFVIGHRGFPGAAPENTPAAFEAALEAGADGIELDVRFAADGVPVVHHDEAVRHAAGSLPVESTPWEELRGLDLQGKGGPYRLATLEEVLRQLSGRCLLNCEVKPVAPPRRATAVEAVLALVRRVRPRESVLISSFDAEFLAALQAVDRSVPLGFVFDSLRRFNHLEEDPVVEGLASLHPRHDLVDAKFMKRAAERGLAVHAWTVNDAAEASRLLALDVLALITDHPDRGFDFLQAAMPGR